MITKKVGAISWWNPRRKIGIAIIRNQDGSVDRFFLTYAKIISGKEIPSVGDEVRFDVSPTPVPEGKLPIAVAIEILEPVAPAAESGSKETI